MSKKKRGRPISNGIEYVIPGHVIGGSEPESWEITAQAKKDARITENASKDKPIRSGPVVEAKYENECWWCGKPINVGEKIAPVELPEDDPRSRWLHAGCTRGPGPGRPTRP